MKGQDWAGGIRNYAIGVGGQKTIRKSVVGRNRKHDQIGPSLVRYPQNEVAPCADLGWQSQRHGPWPVGGPSNFMPLKLRDSCQHTSCPVFEHINHRETRTILAGERARVRTR